MTILYGVNITDDIRMQIIHRYAVANGYIAGFPTFEQADSNDEQGVIYGIVLLKPGSYINFQDGPRSQLEANGTHDMLKDAGASIMAVNRYASNHCYFTNFPDFEQADYNDGRGVVYGSMLLQADIYVDFRGASGKSLLITVPNVVGWTISGASLALETVQLVALIPPHVPGSDIVTSQSIGGGTIVLPGTTVALSIN